MKTINDLLSEHPFLKNLSPENLKVVAGCGKNVFFKKGDQVIKEGDTADYFYVIRRGTVALDIDGIQQGPIRIQTIEEGGILGWSWLIPPHKYQFSAVAVEAVDAVALDGKCLRGKCEGNHHLGYELLKAFTAVLATRVRWTRMQLLDVYGAKT
jgi:CRP-like cAMP-binding protein